MFLCGKRDTAAGYHAIVVTVDHDRTSAPQVDVLLPPVAHLQPKQAFIVVLLLIQKHRTKH